jgi:hypothetical protein
MTDSHVLEPQGSFLPLVSPMLAPRTGLARSCLATPMCTGRQGNLGDGTLAGPQGRGGGSYPGLLRNGILGSALDSCPGPSGAN